MSWKPATEPASAGSDPHVPMESVPSISHVRRFRSALLGSNETVVRNEFFFENLPVLASDPPG